MLHYDTEWNYKHLVITVAVHKMDFEAVEYDKRQYLAESWEKDGEYTKNLEQLFLITFDIN